MATSHILLYRKKSRRPFWAKTKNSSEHATLKKGVAENAFLHLHLES